MQLSSLLWWLVGASSGSMAWARVAPAAAVVTPAPAASEVELRQRQASGADLASLLPLLATAVPPSILALALTNVPAVSRLLWSEFLDDNTPSWFTALPTDVQAYLSGEFGPTTTTSASHSTLSSIASTPASATSSSSPTASANQASEPLNKNSDGGLPLWAKVLIGVLVPLVVLGLLALLLCCCLRRRRRRRRAARNSKESRAPTPAFISNSYRRTDAPGEQHVPLRGGYLSAPDSHHHSLDPVHPYGSSTSNSGDFHTPVGGPSYEDIPPATAAAGKHSRRSSRQSLSSLHSVPEVPEPTHRRNPQQGLGQSHDHTVGAMAIPHPPPPRSPRRSQSRDFSSYDFNHDGSVIKPTQSNERRVSPLNPTYGGNQSSNGGHYAATGPYDNEYVHHDGQRHRDPFSDPSPPRHSGYMGAGEGFGGMQQGMRQEPEMFLPQANAPGAYRQQEEYEWPLRSPPENGRIRRKPVRNSG